MLIDINVAHMQPFIPGKIFKETPISEIFKN